MQIQYWKEHNFLNNWTWASMYNYRATGFGGNGFGQPQRPKDPVWCAVNTADCGTCFACCTTNHPRGGVKYNKCLNRCRLRFGAACDGGSGGGQTIPPPTVNTCGIVCTSGQNEQCHYECPVGAYPPAPQTIQQYPATRNVILTGQEQTVPISPQPDPGSSSGGLLAMISEYWWVPVAGLIAWKVIGK